MIILQSPMVINLNLRYWVLARLWSPTISLSWTSCLLRPSVTTYFLYVPKMGFTVFIDDDLVILLWSKSLKVAFVGYVENNLYVVDFSGKTTAGPMCLFGKADAGWLWHCRLSHVNMTTLQSLQKGGHILGLKYNVSFAKDRVCMACVEGKMHDSPHKRKTIVSSKRILELLHVDLFGPPSHASLGGKKYCLVIVDDYSRYTWVYCWDSRHSKSK